MYKIINRHGQPHGIRNENGYLLFFSYIDKYHDQTDRHIKEVSERLSIAEKIVNFLNSEATNGKTNNGKTN